MNSQSLGFAYKPSARRGIIAFVALGAAVVLVGPVSAQSPSPSTAPAGAAPTAAASAPGGLDALEAGFAAQACDPFLTAEALATNLGVAVTGTGGGRLEPSSSHPGAFHIECTFSVDGGDVSLNVSHSPIARKGKGKPRTADLSPYPVVESGFYPDVTELDGLGDVAFAATGDGDFSYRFGDANVTWAQWIKHGKTFADRTASLSSDVLDVEALGRLAAVIPTDATPDDGPSAIAPGDAAAPLLGSWTLTDWEDDGFTYDGSATMTATFDAAGTVSRTFDCKRNKGAKRVAITDLFFVDGDRIMTVTGGGGPAGQECRAPSFLEGDPTGFFLFLNAFDPIGSSRQAAWTVGGDTLTIVDGRGRTLTFARASD